MILYHGTDVDSVLDILNHGLDAAKLKALQLDRPTQLGRGWYAAYEAEVAWFFASLAPAMWAGGIRSSRSTYPKTFSPSWLQLTSNEERYCERAVWSATI